MAHWTEGSASTEERESGSAVTAKRSKKVVMPDIVGAQQVAGGPYPGRDLGRAIVPRRIQVLNVRRGTTALYAEFLDALSKEGGGRKLTGWNAVKIMAIVDAYQPRFNANGVGIAFVTVFDNEDSDNADWNHWLEVSDAAVPSSPPPPEALEGRWRLDLRERRKDARRLVRFSLDVTRNNDVFHVSVDAERKAHRYVARLPSRWLLAVAARVKGETPPLSVKRSRWRFAVAALPVAENVYHLRYLVYTFVLTVTSPTAVSVSAPFVAEPIPLVKVSPGTS